LSDPAECALAAALIAFGALNLVGVAGFFRFSNFFVRLHCATVSAIGGTFYPLVAIALAELLRGEALQALSLLAAAALVALLSPTGSHALARAAYRRGLARPHPIREDHLAEATG